MKKTTYIKLVVLLTFLGVFIAWFGVYRANEYKIVSNHLQNQLILDSDFRSEPNYLLIGFRLNKGQSSTSRFTFLVNNRFKFKLVTLTLDKKMEPWQVKFE